MIPDLGDTGLGLYAAILADPADDLRKLVFADHLDEAGHGDLAAYLRARCQLGQLAEWDDGRVEAECEVERLVARLAARNRRWDGRELDALFGPPPEPALAHVYDREAAEGFLANPPPGRLTHLEFGLAEAVEPVLASPALAGLQSLAFTSTHLRIPTDTATVARAADAPAFAGLKSLRHLVDFADADAGFAALSRFAGLRQLDVSRRGLTPAGLAALAASPAARTLRRLRLVGTGMAPAESLRPLLDGPPWPHLAELDLDFPTRDDSAVVAHLVESPNFPRLVSLSARGNSGDLFDPLAGSDAVGRLRRLSLGFPVTNSQLTRLLDSAAVGRVGRLVLTKPVGVAAATRKRYESAFGVPLSRSR